MFIGGGATKKIIIQIAKRSNVVNDCILTSSACSHTIPKIQHVSSQHQQISTQQNRKLHMMALASLGHGFFSRGGTAIVCSIFPLSSFRYMSSDRRRQPKIYTKTGDKGTSAIFTGERRVKDDAVFEALGSIDELSSNIGAAREFITGDGLEDIYTQLQQIQCCLQEIASNVATPRTSAGDAHTRLTTFESAHVDDLETWIDGYTGELPPLRNFILPSGGKAGALLHVARSVCRRAERRVSPLVRDSETDPVCGKYLNRLSDYLFTSARYCSMKEDNEETFYQKPRPARQPKIDA